MVNSIYLSKLIADKLLTDNELSALIGNRVYALIADYGTVYPYISFSVTNIVPSYSKDGGSYDSASVNLVVASKDYDACLDIASRVREIFECRVMENDVIKVGYISVDSISEFYDDSAQCFGKRLILNIGRIINV